ncbi:MAG TPA: carbamoyltransferase C-terminal domain-containing protein [Solirubrobacterales bacterium]|nr:carbamoyltransferase C-terminal domain-containing protein [Solirubrobacterales bacterium]
MNVLGIHDGEEAGVALVADGRVVFAANEERYSRQKMHFGFPFLALQKLFQYTGVEPTDIDHVAVGFEAMVGRPGEGYDYEAEPQLHRKVYSALTRTFGGVMDTKAATYGSLQVLKLLSRNKAELKQNLENAGVAAPVQFFNHHLTHAASAYYTSGRDEALIVTSDGGGDAVSGGVYVARGGTIENKTSFSKLNSAGIFWEIVTQLCGFDPERHGGKITGLAAYSDGEEAYRILGEIYGYNPRAGGMENHRKLAFRDAFEYVSTKCGHLSIEELSAGAQRILEETFVSTVRDSHDRYGLSHVLLAGGTFANVRLNQKILEIPGIESVYVHPNMGDGGIAVGAALLLAAEQGEARPYELRDVYWGDDWSDTAIRAELERSRGVRWRRLDDPADAIGDAMARKQVVGVFQGRMEYGPRALGHRSILAEPTDPTMMDWLNKRLSRTEFMPFAPIVVEPEAPRFFEDFARSAYPSRFMTICLDCTPYCVEKAPGVVHKDGTARPQSVREDTDPYTYRALRAYERRTGLPLAINTSFNKHEAPIVGSPADALDELKRKSVDVLFLESYEAALD